MASAGDPAGPDHQREPTTTLPKKVSPTPILCAWACDRFRLRWPNGFRLSSLLSCVGPLGGRMPAMPQAIDSTLVIVHNGE